MILPPKYTVYKFEVCALLGVSPIIKVSLPEFTQSSSQ